ncbi:ComEC family competence protein [Qipengyuania sp. GH38]|uniref:ComEC/Rec2 family competence protein n=1 Tax=Qipengyuania intermedia TaxID=2867244 RepID=UPI001C8780C4|nr:ComEC/Rec2 family competence protein [Qipengyuania intermedia]MBX7515307.1 ComEC family competence protein [Qipengyuania intermedia]
MAIEGTPQVPFGEPDGIADVAVQRPWRMRAVLSRTGEIAERFLTASSFDRGPWITVAFAAGIGAWFLLDNQWQWSAAIGAAMLLALAAIAVWRGRDDRAALRLAVTVISFAFAIGMAVVWSKSELVGAPAIERPAVVNLDARILEREEQPAEGRVRLTLAARDAEAGQPIKVRVNVPTEKDFALLEEGARVRMKARLMPPSAPILPGAYDFARAAWFKGLAATGSLIGEIEVVEKAGSRNSMIARAQRFLSAHVRSRLDGAPGTIAAAFASGDRGGISTADEDAMRDAGLTHLLSISGLHVSAVIAAAYFLAIKLLALWPWFALRVRLPLVAAGVGAGAGIAYTLLTGAEVPTVRSCIGAMLVLGALALGREPLSMRMVAVAAAAVLFAWPEALVGPSFQMSFSAVIAIIALHNCAPVRAFLAPREESRARWLARRTLMLFVTGLVIEIALTPVVLFHFHRAGLYGAFANVLAIPLVTFVSMPLIAIALLFDLLGAGAPFWRLVGLSLDLLLSLAHFTASQPGAVKLVPHMGLGIIALFVAGGLWLALWRGKTRLWGLVPAALGAMALALSPVPDMLVTRDGGNLGLVDERGHLFVLRGAPGSYARTNIVELAGSEIEPLRIQSYEGANCSADFCTIQLTGGSRDWVVLAALNKQRIDERQLAAACELSDIVVADRWLPRSCMPRWLKIDRRYLERNGGVALYLEEERVRSVASSQGEHGWWQPTKD